MSRIKSVVETLTNLKRLHWSELSLESQVSIVYTSTRNSVRSIRWWQERMDDPTATPTTLKTGEDKIRQLTGSLRTMYPFLDRASNYSEAVIQNIVHDLANINGEDGSVETDEKELIATATKGKPHAWAKTKLVDAGFWPLEDVRTKVQIKQKIDPIMEPKKFPDTDRLELLDRDEIANRTASQLVGKLLISMTSKNQKISKDLEIACLSPMVINLKSMKSYEQQVDGAFTLAKYSPPFIDSAPISKEQIVDMWTILVDKDDADEAKQKLKDEIKAVGALVHTAVRTTSIMSSLSAGLSTMAKNGVPAEVMAAFSAQVLAQLTPQQTA